MFPQYGSWLPLEQVIPEQQVRILFNVLYDLALGVALHCFQVLYYTVYSGTSVVSVSL